MTCNAATHHRRDNCGEMAKIYSQNFWFWGSLGVPPPKGETFCLGMIFAIMQNFTPIGETIAEISVTSQKIQNNLISDKSHASIAVVDKIENTQGDHLSGKPGNVREFDSCQRNVRDFTKNQGNVREKSCQAKVA